MNPDLRCRWLGRVPFADALALQEQIVERKWTDRSSQDQLLLLEHDPVYTIGRTPNQASLRDATHLPHRLFPINRGGQATYHGPGQLVVYPILDLRRYGQDLHRYLRWIEDLLIDVLTRYNVCGSTRTGLTGVWIANRKIASIGVGVRHWITMHGLALNVCGDLSPFYHIVPCGIANVTMTSIAIESGAQVCVEDVAGDLAEIAARRLTELRTDAAKQELIV